VPIYFPVMPHSCQLNQTSFSPDDILMIELSPPL
jgi:hypothetical protein